MPLIIYGKEEDYHSKRDGIISFYLSPLGTMLRRVIIRQRCHKHYALEIYLVVPSRKTVRI
jgi:hypothetical protein